MRHSFSALAAIVAGALLTQTGLGAEPSYRSLRAAALRTTPSALAPEGGAYTVLMELSLEGGVATLVASSDGATSLYFTSGIGLLGAGEHRGASRAARVLVATADRHLHALGPAEENHPLPRPHHARFYVLSTRGVLTAEAHESELERDLHPLSPLFHAGHDLLTEIRLAWAADAEAHADAEARGDAPLRVSDVEEGAALRR